MGKKAVLSDQTINRIHSERSHRARQRHGLFAAAIGAVLGCVAGRSAQAGDATWNFGTSNGSFATDNDWTPKSAPGSITDTDNPDTATFGNVLTGNRVITVDSNRNLKFMTFDAAGFIYTFNSGSFLLTDGGAITVKSNVAVGQVINTPITLEGFYTFTSNDTSAGSGLTIGGSVTGTAQTGNTATLTLAGSSTATNGTLGNVLIGAVSDGIGGGTLGLVKSGAGTWQLNNSTGNTFSGGMSITAGTLISTAGTNPFGTGTIVFGDDTANNSNGATLTSTFQGSYTIANDINVRAGSSGTLTLNMQGGPNSNNPATGSVSGNVSLNNNLTITDLINAKNVATFSGTWTEGGTAPLTITAKSSSTNPIIIFSGGIVLSTGGLTLVGDNDLHSGALGITGGVTGTGNLTLAANGSQGGIIVSNAALNNIGTITNAGTGSGGTSGSVVISGGVGSNVTAITENSPVSALTINTTAINMRGTVGLATTLMNSNASGSSLFSVSAGFTGTGDLVMKNESGITNGITLSSTVNNTGSITNSGGGTNTALISAVIGSNVSSIIQNSSTSTLVLSGVNNAAGGFAATGSTGTVTVTAGTLEMLGTAVLSAANAVTVDTAGTFDLNGAAETIAGLNSGASGGGIVTNGGVAKTLTLGGISTYSFSGALTGTTLSLQVSLGGGGSQALSGSSSYAGTTKVGSGQLLINGSHTGGGAYTMSSGATLGGSGTITPASNASITFASGSKLAPGATAGQAGTLTVTMSGTGVFDISSAVGSTNTGELVFDLGPIASSDKVVLTSGTLNIGTNALSFSDFSFNTLAGFTNGTYVLFDTNAAITGSMLSTGLSGTLGGTPVALSLANGGQDIVLTVPEPTLLSLLSFAGAYLLKRRKRSGSILTASED